jgi:predicted RNA-binding Zn ribbon-like protein
VKFAFVSGNLALDFAGTLKWRRHTPEELLAVEDDLADWAVEAGVFTEWPAVHPGELTRMRDLREAVYRLVTGSPQPGDQETINACATGRPPTLQLAADGVTRTGTVDSIGWAVAWALGELLTEQPHVRECERTECTRIFIDRSRSANRRWCGMQECGNRIKAAAYRARKLPG